MYEKSNKANRKTKAQSTKNIILFTNDEAAIRALEDKFATAFNAGDIDAMMKNYIPGKSLVVSDVVPPGQHHGADAYRKAWMGFFALQAKSCELTFGEK